MRIGSCVIREECGNEREGANIWCSPWSPAVAFGRDAQSMLMVVLLLLSYSAVVASHVAKKSLLQITIITFQRPFLYSGWLPTA